MAHHFLGCGGGKLKLGKAIEIILTALGAVTGKVLDPVPKSSHPPLQRSVLPIPALHHALCYQKLQSIVSFSGLTMPGQRNPLSSELGTFTVIYIYCIHTQRLETVVRLANQGVPERCSVEGCQRYTVGNWLKHRKGFKPGQGVVPSNFFSRCKTRPREITSIRMVNRASQLIPKFPQYCIV
jgi:hypothetical protein